MDAPRPDYPNPLLPLHRQAEAETQPFDAVEIVATFGQPQAEYAAIRKGAGLMDLPQRGSLEVTGKDRHAFLGNLFTNQVWWKDEKRGLPVGEGRYAFFLNLKGRIAADLNVLEVGGDRTLIETDVRLVAMLRSVLDRYLFAEDVKLTDRVGDLHELALHGPLALDVLNDALDAPIPPLEVMNCAAAKSTGGEVIVWRDDPCGVPGYHLIAAPAVAENLWSTITTRHGGGEVGKRAVRPVGWAAFNACRIEGGRPIFGIDFEYAAPSLPGKQKELAEGEAPAPRGVLPAETGQFDRAVCVTKGCYLGQEVVARMHARKQVARQLVGVKMSGPDLPFSGSPVFDGDRNEVGLVTSSTVSPVLSGAAICLAFVKKPFFEVGRELLLPAEGSVGPGKVVELPFLSG